MIINRVNFFSTIRSSLFQGKLTQAQVDNLNALLDYALPRVDMLQRVAYILATVYHETAGTMQAIEEYGRGRGHDYGRKFDMGKGPGQRVAYATPDKLYYGRGHVQLTWLSNYRTMGQFLGLPLVSQPELMLQPDISTKAAIEGMVRGMFTGKKLSDYFNETTTDANNARRIINGMDKAALIQQHFSKFLAALIS